VHGEHGEAGSLADQRSSLVSSSVLLRARNPDIARVRHERAPTSPRREVSHRRCSYWCNCLRCRTNQACRDPCAVVVCGSALSTRRALAVIDPVPSGVVRADDAGIWLVPERREHRGVVGRARRLPLCERAVPIEDCGSYHHHSPTRRGGRRSLGLGTSHESAARVGRVAVPKIGCATLLG